MVPPERHCLDLPVRVLDTGDERMARTGGGAGSLFAEVANHSQVGGNILYRASRQER